MKLRNVVIFLISVGFISFICGCNTYTTTDRLSADFSNVIGHFRKVLQSVADKDVNSLKQMLDDKTQLAYGYSPGEGSHIGPFSHPIPYVNRDILCEQFIKEVRWHFTPQNADISFSGNRNEITVSAEWLGRSEEGLVGSLKAVYIPSNNRWILKKLLLEEEVQRTK
ncbi:MAG: hypothetical protein A2W23_06695 [Planctomycetes bacterium RBG_16_43_13]|nr:MAG: hypothetical protein A2W23_06695 [Planctomycetes bacterium RBG_16_43_13]